MTEYSRVGASCVGRPICVCAVLAPLRRVNIYLISSCYSITQGLFSLSCVTISRSFVSSACIKWPVFYTGRIRPRETSYTHSSSAAQHTNTAAVRRTPRNDQRSCPMSSRSAAGAETTVSRLERGEGLGGGGRVATQVRTRVPFTLLYTP